MSGWARPGVKCVCIRVTNPKSQLVLGGIYTVKSATDVPDLNGDWGLELVEASPVLHPKYFKGKNFRPLVPPKTQEQDLEHFLPLLKTRELVE